MDPVIRPKTRQKTLEPGFDQIKTEMTQRGKRTVLLSLAALSHKGHPALDRRETYECKPTPGHDHPPHPLAVITARFPLPLQGGEGCPSANKDGVRGSSAQHALLSAIGDQSRSIFSVPVSRPRPLRRPAQRCQHSPPAPPCRVRHWCHLQAPETPRSSPCSACPQRTRST